MLLGFILNMDIPLIGVGCIYFRRTWYERKTKFIKLIILKKINGHNIDLGYSNKETHGKYKYSWF